MIVMKFGGTSVGSGERLLNVAEIVAAHKERQPVIVVSAMSQVTNVLVELADNTTDQRGQRTVAIAIKQIRQLHEEAVRALGLEPTAEDALLETVHSRIAKLEGIAESIAVLGELTTRGRDQIISFGERLAIHLVSAALQSRGLAATAIEASDLIVTDATFGNAQPLLPATRKRMKSKLPRLIEKGIIPVITGFIGATPEGSLTTLGRGGSDYSATLVGYGLAAEEVWIWTDVDGVMTADPRTITGAHTIAELSYNEAAELSHFGAKVLHPRTMIPAALGNTPIWIKNTLKPEGRGTRITDQFHQHPDGAKAMTSLKDLSLIAIQGKGMQGAYDIAATVFTVLAAQKIQTFFVSLASSENNISVVVDARNSDRATRALRAGLRPELATKSLEAVDVEKHVAIVAVVGEGMRNHTGIAGRIFSALGRADINIMAIAQGSSERNISFVVREDQVTAALQSVHDELHLEKKNSEEK